MAKQKNNRPLATLADALPQLNSGANQDIHWDSSTGTVIARVANTPKFTAGTGTMKDMLSFDVAINGRKVPQHKGGDGQRRYPTTFMPVRFYADHAVELWSQVESHPLNMRGCQLRISGYFQNREVKVDTFNAEEFIASLLKADDSGHGIFSLATIQREMEQHLTARSYKSVYLTGLNYEILDDVE